MQNLCKVKAPIPNVGRTLALNSRKPLKECHGLFLMTMTDLTWAISPSAFLHLFCRLNVQWKGKLEFMLLTSCPPLIYSHPSYVAMKPPTAFLQTMLFPHALLVVCCMLCSCSSHTMQESHLFMFPNSTLSSPVWKGWGNRPENFKLSRLFSMIEK